MTAKKRRERDHFTLGSELNLSRANLALTKEPAPQERERNRVLKKPRPNSRTGKTKDLRKKRTRRPKRYDRGTGSDLEILEWALRSPMTFRLAAWIEEDLAIDARVGRPRDCPTFMFVIWLILLSCLGSHRRVDRFLRNAHVRRIIDEVLADAWPDDPHRRVHGKRYSRFQFHRFRERHFVPADTDDDATRQEKNDRRDGVRAVFSDIALELADAMGFGDPAFASWAAPRNEDVLAGDGTYVPALFDAAEGDTQVDRETGEIVPIRYDPDARSVQSADGEWVTGTGWVNWLFQRPGADNERVTVGFAPIETGIGEAGTSVALLDTLALPEGVRFFTYDMAIRGTHIRHLYRTKGVVPVVKVARDTKGRPRSARIDVLVVAGQRLPIFALDGVAGILCLVQAEDVFVPLEPLQLRRPANKRGDWRFYGEWRIPDHPAVATELRGETVRLRLDESDSVAENLRFVNEHTPEFGSLHGVRQSTESENNRFKQTLWNGRAHSVGKARQTLDVLGFHMLGHLKAARAFKQRTGTDPIGFAEPAGLSPPLAA